MKLACAAACLAAVALVPSASATKGRVVLPQVLESYKVKSAKSLRRLLEENLRDGTMSPLVYSTLAFPNGHDKIDALGPIFGSSFVVKGGATHTVTAFARHTLINRIIEVHGQNVALSEGSDEENEEEEGEEESVALDFSILSDVPSLMHFNHKYVMKTPATATLPLHDAIRGIQKNLVESIAALENVNVGTLRIPAHFVGFQVHDECDKLMVLEAAAIQRLKEVLPLAKEEALKPVVLVTLTQALTCYADKADYSRLFAGVELLQGSLPAAAIKTVVPTRVWAGLDSVETMAREIIGGAARRRLQEIEDQLHDDLLWIEKDAELQQALEGGTNDSESLPESIMLDFIAIEKRQIILWTTLALTVATVMAVWAIVYMPLNKDPLLYTRIMAGH